VVADFKSGKVKGIVIAYVMEDGQTAYKLMGCLADRNNPRPTMALVTRLKERVERLFFGSSC
jgi:hypothetical protein